MRRDRAIGREETLGVRGRLEPLHPSFPLAGGLMGVFRTIVQVPVLPMFDTGQELAQGRPLTLELIRDDHPRHIGQLGQ
jgi:hypothetical protein